MDTPTADSAATGEAPTKGYGWAVAMIAFMVGELLIVASPSPLQGAAMGSGRALLLLYLGVALGLELAGVALTRAGRYRAGGILQIVASAGHIPDLMGILGLVGGLKAYRYPERMVHWQARRGEAAA